MFSQPSDPVREQALTVLIAQFVAQGHPIDYAKHMATAAIFQADLDLRNAQLAQLLQWLQQQHPDVYPGASQLVEHIRQEFEKRVQQS
jgi:hypothetical protein